MCLYITGSASASSKGRVYTKVYDLLHPCSGYFKKSWKREAEGGGDHQMGGDSTSHYDFFLIGIHSMKGWTATIRHGVTRKRSTK